MISKYLTRLAFNFRMCVLFLIVIQSICCYSQQKNLTFSLSKVINTNIDLSQSTLKYSVSFSDEKIYWISYSSVFDSEKKEYNKYYEGLVFNTKENSTDTLKLYFNVENIPYNINFNRHFTINGDFIVLSCLDRIKIFKRDTNLIFKEYASISNNKFNLFDFFNINKDKIFCGFVGDYSQKTDSSKLRLAVFDLKLKKFIALKENQSFKGIEFTHFTHNFIDSRKNEVAVANTLDYKIYFYDEELKLKDSITKFIGKWNESKNLILDKKYVGDQLSMLEDLSNIDDTIYRVEKIYYLNDSTLLVSYKSPSKSSEKFRTIDVWQKQKSKWKNIIVNQRLNYSFNDNDSVSIHSFQPNFSSSSPILFNDSLLAYIGLGMDIPKTPIIRSEYKAIWAKKYLTTPKRFDICLYKWSIE